MIVTADLTSYFNQTTHQHKSAKWSFIAQKIFTLSVNTPKMTWTTQTHIFTFVSPPMLLSGNVMCQNASQTTKKIH